MKRSMGEAGLNRVLAAFGSGTPIVIPGDEMERQWKRDRKRVNRRKRAARIRRHGR